MAPHTHSFVSFLALLGAAPLVSTRALRNTFMPRQATPGFECSYPAGWESCNTKDSRDCWVRDPNGKEYNVDTDYEDNVPEGTTRIINLEIDEKDISPDGFTPQKTAQLINGKFPGELIEACWGDTLEVHVTNKLQRNGTTIHWHGIRQLGSNEMDGVNGVTQCPVSEDDTYVYKFKLTQYGHSWYHSHYSSQYSDGVAAPLLVHGPNTANWEEEWAPIIVNDWFHRSAFEAFHQSMTALPAPGSSILVDGHGHYQNSDGVVTGTYFERDFEPGKSYLLRIVNGGTDLHFQFSIDGHTLEVVHADFVPIKPYNTSSISVGIGQRYSVIVRANPETESSNGKYWIRTEYTTANGCNFAMDYPKPNNQDGMRTGIISYPNAGEGNPTSQRHSDIVVGCLDEKIEPRIPWTVSAPQNDVSKNTHFFAGNDRITQSHGFFRWELAETPLWINFSDPTILNLKNTTWNPEYAIEHYNYTNEEEFVYMIINSGNGTQNMFAGHHPIHLHGHDFAVISQGAGIFDPAVHTVNLDNPPRRDVAMLPNNGHLVLAFKPDNPGVWLIHCHIGWHAGSGLALQVLERQNEIADRIGSLNPVQNGCQKWDGWMATHPNVFNYTMQEDSGI